MDILDLFSWICLTFLFNWKMTIAKIFQAGACHRTDFSHYPIHYRVNPSSVDQNDGQPIE